MVKLTSDLILQSAQYINPVRDRELSLRGYKIPVIENLGASMDQFDTIDLSDNDIRKLDGFPLLKRLKCLLLSNNRIVKIAEGLEENIPNLEMLVLTNNQIQELADVDPLAAFKRLENLSLLKNQVTVKQHYRLYVIYKLPQLRILDFRKIKMKERDEANELFKSKKGKLLEKELQRKVKTFVPGGELEVVEKTTGPSVKEIEAIRDAISMATSLADIERLTRLLGTGQVPGKPGDKPKAQGKPGEDVEEMETESGGAT
jgi:U2 small nuclear ribonucleoprotein A'